MDHRAQVGGMWDEIGKLQFDFMIDWGLRPHHKLLDIGCGCLRGGVHFIKYLDDDCYYGIDKDKELLKSGWEEVVKSGTAHWHYSLKLTRYFEFDLFGVQFDYAIAQSVFTHLNLNEILLCLVNVEKVLKPTGRCYTSFFSCANKNDYAKTIEHLADDNKTIQTQAAFSRSIHYTADQLVWAGHWAGLQAEYIGKWGHPRKQEMMVYYR